MGELELTFIGAGNAFAPGGLCWNGFVVNGTHLFEAPPTALVMLQRAGIDPNALRTVVVSHHHGDHFLGLPFLFLHWKHRGRTAPVRIVGPTGTETFTREIAGRTFPGLFGDTFPVEWVELGPGGRVDANGLDLRAVEVHHDDRLTMNLGFEATVDGRRFAYTGDSALCDAVLELARGAEVMVSECASRFRAAPTHMSLVDDMPVIRDAMVPGASLMLTHLAPDVDANGMRNTIVARELQAYRF